MLRRGDAITEVATAHGAAHSALVQSGPTQSEARAWGLDALRAAMMLLGIFFHAAWAYVPGIGRWYVVEDTSTAMGFDVLTKVLHVFRMQTFFVLAGYFAHLVFARRGANAFLVDRAKRLLLPFAVAVTVSMLFDWQSRQWARLLGVLHPDYPGGDAFLFRPLYLWFLPSLFGCCALAWASSSVGVTGAAPSRWLARVLRVPEVLVLGFVVTAAGLVYLGEPLAWASFAPDAASLVHHLPFFALGWLLWAARDATEVLARRGWWLAPIGLALACWLFSGPHQYGRGGLVLSALASWLCVVGLVALGLRMRALQGVPKRVVSALVDASYWTYLVHYPVVVTAQLALAGASLPALAKYGAVVSVASLTAALSWVALRRTPLAAVLGSKGARPA